VAALEDGSSRPGAPAHQTPPSVQHRRTRAYTPRTNGNAERFIQTLLREWAYAVPYATSHERRQQLRRYLAYYNRRRPHASLNYYAPWSRLTTAADKQRI
jgi:transposase InsO family protein